MIGNIGQGTVTLKSQHMCPAKTSASDSSGRMMASRCSCTGIQEGSKPHQAAASHRNCWLSLSGSPDRLKPRVVGDGEK